jgi:DnaJ-domain-containing protein 1
MEVRMSTFTAVIIVAILLMVTLLVGIASQVYGRVAAPEPPPRTAPTPPPPAARTRSRAADDLEEDLDVLHESIEAARSELLWLREQVARERARLERVRRQAPPSRDAAPESPPAPTPLDSPWVVLGLKPGASIEEVRRRYRLLCRVWHPDRFVDGPAELRAEAETMMARLNKAHNALSGQAAGFRR